MSLESVMEQRVVFISARKGYATKGLRAEGFDVVYPYRDKTLFGRVIREIWFRSGLPERVWYTKIKRGIDNIIVQDPLITKKYLEWLKKTQPKSKIHFLYGNMVGNAKHVTPNCIPEGITKWTFDMNDSKKYGIMLHSSGGYSTSYIGSKKAILYDVFYVGTDKGRGGYVCELEKQINMLGLKTKFIITANGKLSKKKGYYSKPIPYSEVIEYDNASKSILNIVMPNQIGATMRDFESIFNSVKLITTNQSIKDYDFYKEENVFILGERNLSELPDFLNSPFQPIEEKILKKYTIPALVEEIVTTGKTSLKIYLKDSRE